MNDTEKHEWELVAQNTYRLKVESGYLYRVADARAVQMVFVPRDSDDLYNIAAALDEFKDLFDNCTFSLNEFSDATAIRTSDIGQ